MVLYVHIFILKSIYNLEPGYYEDGKFGIRIEDIVRIVPAKAEYNFNGRGALTFQTVTMCPIQTKLILPELLTEKEVYMFKTIIKKNQIFILFFLISRKII